MYKSKSNMLERNEEIRYLRRQRYTLKEIGLKFNLTHERVRQICEGLGKDKLPVDKSEWLRLHYFKYQAKV